MRRQEVVLEAYPKVERMPVRKEAKIMAEIVNWPDLMFFFQVGYP